MRIFLEGNAGKFAAQRAKTNITGMRAESNEARAERKQQETHSTEHKTESICSYRITNGRLRIPGEFVV
jgi:hypothetical protein